MFSSCLGFHSKIRNIYINGLHTGFFFTIVQNQINIYPIQLVSAAIALEYDDCLYYWCKQNGLHEITIQGLSQQGI